MGSLVGLSESTAIQKPQLDAITSLFNYIAGIWQRFGGKRSPDEMRQMQIAWIIGLKGVTMNECVAAINRKVKEGQVYPPSSPAELRAWVMETKLGTMPDMMVKQQAAAIRADYPIYGKGQSLEEYAAFMLVGVCSLHKFDHASSVAAVMREF